MRETSNKIRVENIGEINSYISWQSKFSETNAVNDPIFCRYFRLRTTPYILCRFDIASPNQHEVLYATNHASYTVFCIMVTHIARVWINLVRLPILLVVSCIGKQIIFPCPRSCLRDLVSRVGFGSPVPRQPAHLHTQAESGAY